jgi:hypothetical protein
VYIGQRVKIKSQVIETEVILQPYRGLEGVIVDPGDSVMVYVEFDGAAELGETRALVQVNDLELVS